MSDTVSEQSKPILDRFKIDQSQFLGKGGEGHVYSLNDTQVIKIYPKASELYLKQLQALQEKIAQARLPFQTPLIDSIDKIDGTYFTIEKKLFGQNLETVFATLPDDSQKIVLRRYLEALTYIREIEVPGDFYGQILLLPDSIKTNSWKEFLLKKLHQKIEPSWTRISEDVVECSKKLVILEKMIESLIDDNILKSVVHGDYYLNNVLVNEQLEISSVLDFSVHSCIGDYRLDVANINFLPLCNAVTKEHLDVANTFVIAEYGEELSPYLDLYGFYYAFYFSHLYTTDMTSYKWCLGILNDEKRWGKYNSYLKQ